jgi:PAS domain S-box-containing protein
MRPGGELFWARLEATLASDGEQGPSVCRAVMSDVTERKRADEARDYLDNLLSHVNTPIIVWGSDFQITRFNGAFERLTGLKADDVLGRKLDFIFPKDRRPEIMTRIRRSAAGKCWEEMEIPVRCLDGTVRTLLWNSAALVAADGTTVMVTIAQGQDITERMRAESQREAALKVLHERRDYLDSLLTYASAPIVVWDPDFRITRFNGAFEHLTGLQAGDMLGRELDILFPEARRDEAMAYTRRADAGERWEAVEIPIRHVDGTTRIVLWNSATLYAADGTTVIATIAQGQDITERVQAEEQIKAALAEKEVLMREIYHRVKNNLQALIYLMDMQADYIPDASARQMIRELQERARSMALVHEKLYQSHNLAQVDFGDYLHDLVDNLSRAFGTGRLIIWRVEAENALLSVETAIPCGLVVTELLTNALKYAFPDGQPRTGRDETECKINVEFRAEGERFTLVVADNGVGLPPDLDWTTTPSLGLQLINVLACHQLGGQVEVDTRAGTAFKITFAERNNR